MPTIQFRRGTSAAAAANNPTLAAGEPGFETDTRRWKIGDGAANWAALPYQGADAEQADRVTAPPGGKLSLTSGAPWTTADVTAAATLYYPPVASDRIALFDPATGLWAAYTFTQPSLGLGTLTSGKNYDVFAYNYAGTPSVPTVSGTFVNSGTGVSSLAVTISGVAAGDLILAFVTAADNGSLLVPTGYTYYGAAYNTASGPTVFLTGVFYKRAVGGETSVTCPFSATVSEACATVYVLQNADVPEAVTSVGTGNTSLVLPSLTTLGANRLLVGCYAWWFTASSPAITVPVGQTATTQNTVLSVIPRYLAQRTGYESVASAGATGTRTATSSVSGLPCGVHLAIPYRLGVQLELGAAWTNDTTRSAALAAQDGIPVKSSDHSRRYLGTIRTVSTTTTEDSLANRCLFDYYRPDLWKTTSGYNRLHFAGWSPTFGPQGWSSRAALTASQTITGASSYQDVTDLSITLPGAGEYEVACSLWGTISLSAGSAGRIFARIVLNGTPVTNSEFMVVRGIGTAPILIASGSLAPVKVTATGAHVVKVQAARAGTTPTWVTSEVTLNSEGGCYLSVRRVG